MKKSLKQFKKWERIFIRLTYPTESIEEIAKILNRKPIAIIAHATYNKIKRQRPEIIKPLDKFGKLTVIKQLPNDSKNSKRWKCRCECGTISNCSTHTLTSGHSQSCGCERLISITKGTENVPGWYYGQLKKNAKHRDIYFDISLLDIEKLLIEQDFKCALTNLPIKLYNKNIRKTKTLSTASLDRIDNTKGYTKNNVQWLHTDVNLMKHVYEQEYFIKICNLVTENHICTKEFKNATYRFHIKKITKSRKI